MYIENFPYNASSARFMYKVQSTMQDKLFIQMHKSKKIKTNTHFGLAAFESQSSKDSEIHFSITYLDWYNGGCRLAMWDS